MPSPTLPMQLGDVTTNPLLTQISVLTYQKVNPVAPRIFKSIPVDNQVGHFFRYPRGTFFRSQIRRAGPGSRPPRTALNRVLSTYQTDVYHVAHDIPDMLRYNQQGGALSLVDLERTATFKVTDELVRGLDDLWFQTFFKAGIWGANYAGVASGPNASQFIQFDQAASNPIDTVQRILIERARATGVKLNTAVIDPMTFQVIINHPLVKAQIQYTQRTIAGETLTPELLAQTWGIKEVIVPDTVVNKGDDMSDDNPAVGSGGMDFITASGGMTRGIFLGYVPDSPAEDQPACGYTFLWRYGGTANDQGIRISDWYDNETSTTTIKGEAALGYTQVSPELGVVLSAPIGF